MRSNAAALRAARQRKGWTLKDLAAASGISFQRISDLERDDSPTYPNTAKALAAALEVDIEDIATIEETVA